MTNMTKISATSNNGSSRPRAIVWHRRDLRLDDNRALFECLSAGFEPVGLFLFDDEILKSLSPSDRRVDFICQSVELLARAYARHGCAFEAVRGVATKEIRAAAARHACSAVFANRDYEPRAKERDLAAEDALALDGVAMSLHKDQVVFESHEVLSLAGKLFSVFTPYKNAWLAAFSKSPPLIFPSSGLMSQLGLAPIEHKSSTPSLKDLGFQPANLASLGLAPGEAGAKSAAKAFASAIASYAADRDFPAKPATSKLGAHFRFGTASVRRMAIWARSAGGQGADVWLSELIWREFYSAILDANPRLAQGECHQRKYDALRWENNLAKFSAWKAGLTGVPIVDAAMRELAQTGHMHNRCRMVAASYLCKHLDCDWRWGEAHFAALLMDYDLASNNGGWQWSASTGADAQPYFRIFNPARQSERFDPNADYIKRWVPELAACPAKLIHGLAEAKPAMLAASGIVLGQDYPFPLVSHAAGRAAAILKYKAASGECSE